MQKRTIKVAILAVLAVILVLSFSSVALADQTWSDLPDTVTAKYGITDNQVAAISEGFPGGLWKPYQSVTRAQFTKMAVMAFDVHLANPATASYTDVPKTNYYYQVHRRRQSRRYRQRHHGHHLQPQCQHHPAAGRRHRSPLRGYGQRLQPGHHVHARPRSTTLLAHFGDAASISADLKDEVAFAYDFGLTKGDDYGNVAPLANLTRIQGAAFLIRAQAQVPPAQWTAANIELVSEDKTENLIGQAHKATFKVTDAAGHPAIGVLVDFDVLTGGPTSTWVTSPTKRPSPTAIGQVTVNLISTEPGTAARERRRGRPGRHLHHQVLAGAGRGLHHRSRLGKPRTTPANPTPGAPGSWSSAPARVPPAQDWYNAIDADFDPADIDEEDGVDWVAFDAKLPPKLCPSR